MIMRANNNALIVAAGPVMNVNTITAFAYKTEDYY